jgi:hypothetical protein
VPSVEACGKLEGVEYDAMLHHLPETSMNQFGMVLKELGAKANEKRVSRIT